MDINKYIKESHSVARSKGFWDNNRSVDSLVMLTITEISEAVDADRIGNYANFAYFETRLKETSSTINRSINYEEQMLHVQESYVKSFKMNIKDSVEDEIADTLIRLFDMYGGLGIEYKECSKDSKGAILGSFNNCDTFVEKCMYITSMATKIYEANCVGEMGLISTYMGNTVFALIKLAESINIDIEAHIVYKMKFNSYRDKLNGKLY